MDNQTSKFPLSTVFSIFLLRLGMSRYISWNKVKDAVYGHALTKSYFSACAHVKRRLIFRPSNEPNDEALPVSITQGESTVAGSQATVAMSMMQVDFSTPDQNKQESRSVDELAIPAALSIGIYGSIPAGVQLDHHDVVLYEPLLVFICLAVFTSLCNAFYSLSNPGGGAHVEAIKQRVMAAAIAFLLVAFILRILLLVSIISLEFVGIIFFLGAAVMMATLCFVPWSKKESRDVVGMGVAVADSAADYTVHNHV